jgi:hypothetical protein
MRKGLRKIVGIGFGFLALSLVVLGPSALRVSAAAVSVTSIQVTVCGNAILEVTEECDPGKRCANGVLCVEDATCAGIGDGLCKLMATSTCTALCKTIVGGGVRPPVTQVTITEVTGRPEQRNLSAGNNYDSDFYFTILNSNNSNHQTPLYEHPSMLTSNASGTAFPYVTLPDYVTAGTYDALLKTKAHLAKLQDNVYLIAGDNILNFTSPDNSAAIGSSTLLAGDIDGAGNSMATFGDNVINSVDISILLNQIGSNDPSGNTYRSNLNQDNWVDQSDLTIMVGNIDKEGDR